MPSKKQFLGCRKFHKTPNERPLQEFHHDNGLCFKGIDIISKIILKYARNLTVVVDINDLRQEDLAFFRENFSGKTGKQKLSFYIKNPADQSQVELFSMKSLVDINGNLLEVFNQARKWEVFLN